MSYREVGKVTPAARCDPLPGNIACAEPLQAILAAEDRFPPGAVFQVPTDRRFEPRGAVLTRLPTELVPQLAGVDRVAEVVAGTVGDKRDLLGMRSPIGTPLQPVHDVAQLADQVDVAKFVVAANVVRLAGLAAAPD